MNKQNLTKINGTALIRAFKNRGMKHSDIAQQFGYGAGYFNYCARENTIPTALAELLWNELNIPLTEYSAEMPLEARGDEKWQTLYETIYKAFLDAFNDVQGGIYASVLGAMRKALKEDREGGLENGTER